MNGQLRRHIASAALIIGFFVAWEVLCIAFGIKEIVLPRPSQILAELVELRILRLAFDWNGALAETAAVRIKHGADLGEALQRIDLGFADQMAVGPIIVARRQDERVPDALKRVVDRLVIFLGAREQSNTWVWIITPGIILRVANMDDKGEVDSVKRCEHALILLFLYMRVGHVTNQAELEWPILRLRLLRPRRQRHAAVATTPPRNSRRFMPAP